MLDDLIISIFLIMLNYRKYVPVEVDDCEKAFVNVFSISKDSEEAFVCCNGFEDNSSLCNASVRISKTCYW
jgi:hypothetical protein